MPQRAATKLIAGLCVVLALMSAAAVYRSVMRGRGDPDVFALVGFSRAVFAAQVRTGPRYPAIVGDSIAAQTAHQPVCGRPVVVAAIAGASLRHALADILPLLRHDPPAGLVIAIGVNDAKRLIAAPRARRLAAFEADYGALIVKAQALTPDVAVVLIPPVGKDDWFGAAAFDADLIAEFNRIITRLAAEAHVPVFSLSALAGPDGFARAGATVDGVHPSAAGYAVWMSTIEQAWNRIKACR
jgi:lysophospholipase L1-like esterase